jgi:hypothetical protein
MATSARAILLMDVAEGIEAQIPPPHGRLSHLVASPVDSLWAPPVCGEWRRWRSARRNGLPSLSLGYAELLASVAAKVARSPQTSHGSVHIMVVVGYGSCAIAHKIGSHSDQASREFEEHPCAMGNCGMTMQREGDSLPGQLSSKSSEKCGRTLELSSFRRL